MGKAADVEHLILVAGTNHIPAEGPRIVFAKLRGMLEHAKDIFPQAKIYVSSILPKLSEGVLPGIEQLNTDLNRICRKLGIDLIYNKQFFGQPGFLDTTYLARDKIHLSKRGVATLATNIRYRLRKFGQMEIARSTTPPTPSVVED